MAPPAVTQVAYDAGGLITLAWTRAGHGQVVACGHLDVLRELILWRYNAREAWQRLTEGTGAVAARAAAPAIRR
jgi:hypothetical protein